MIVKKMLKVMALMLLVGGTAHAEITSRTFEPSAPTSEAFIRLRINHTIQVWDPTITVVTTNESQRSIRVESLISDVCNPSNPLHTAPVRYVDVGVLSAGVYKAAFWVCGDNIPPGQPECTQVGQTTLVVTGVAGGPRLVPTVSLMGLMVLLAGILTAAAIGMGRGWPPPVIFAQL
jgi:hypothetical protein